MKQTLLIITAVMLVVVFTSGQEPIEELSEELKLVVLDVWNDANNRDIESLKSAHFNSPRFSKFGPRFRKDKMLMKLTVQNLNTLVQ
jgi:hypothetical protein